MKKLFFFVVMLCSLPAMAVLQLVKEDDLLVTMYEFCKTHGKDKIGPNLDTMRKKNRFFIAKRSYTFCSPDSYYSSKEYYSLDDQADVEKLLTIDNVSTSDCTDTISWFFYDEKPTVPEGFDNLDDLNDAIDQED